MACIVVSRLGAVARSALVLTVVSLASLACVQAQDAPNGDAGKGKVAPPALARLGQSNRGDPAAGASARARPGRGQEAPGTAETVGAGTPVLTTTVVRDSIKDHVFTSVYRTDLNRELHNCHSAPAFCLGLVDLPVLQEPAALAFVARPVGGGNVVAPPAAERELSHRRRSRARPARR